MKISSELPCKSSNLCKSLAIEASKLLCKSFRGVNGTEGTENRELNKGTKEEMKQNRTPRLPKSSMVQSSAPSVPSVPFDHLLFFHSVLINPLFHYRTEGTEGTEN